MSQEIKIRYNTEKDKTDPTLPAWRVLTDGVEHLAESVDLNTRCWTSQDEISPGLIKWHISCTGRVYWDGRKCRVEALSESEKPATREIKKTGVIWLTGLSAAGKTTIARALALRAKALGISVEELDGDAIREVFPATGFSRDERDQHIRRVGFMASRLEAHGVLVIASLISPIEESRDFVRKLCGNYFEVFVDTPLNVCESRDPKGLYKKARAGLLKGFTGIDDPYETPSRAELTIHTANTNPEQAAEEILRAFLKQV